MSYNLMCGIPNLLFTMKLLFDNFQGNALEDVIIDLERQGIEVLLVGVQEQPKYLMKVIGMIGELIEEEHLFENFSTARLWINQQNGGK